MTLKTGELADDNLAFFRKMLLKCKTILQYFNLPCFFNQINAVLVSIRDFFQKNFFF